MILATLLLAAAANAVAITHHVLHMDGTTIPYTAGAGTIALKNAKGQPDISMFYTAYTKDGADPATRPVTFFYNGGPGGSSVWQRMAAFGPVRVLVPPPGQSVWAPYRVVDNEYSLLDVTDEVYVDAPGSGFSRLLPSGKPTDAYGVDADAAAFAQFIRLYCSQYGRWDAPKYLFGESYGTIRSAAVARLMENGFGQAIDLNGVVLMSSALNVDLLWDDAMVGGNDWPFVLFLPTEAATAWYYRRVDRSTDLPTFLSRVERFALTDYLTPLLRATRCRPTGARRSSRSSAPTPACRPRRSAPRTCASRRGDSEATCSATKARWSATWTRGTPVTTRSATGKSRDGTLPISPPRRKCRRSSTTTFASSSTIKQISSTSH
jgi:carboxypeptidase C (cathepsin A)